MPEAADRDDMTPIPSLLRDVAPTSAYLDHAKPVIVVPADKPLGTHYKLRACPFDMRDQFAFASDLTLHGKQAVYEAGAREPATWAVVAPPALRIPTHGATSRRHTWQVGHPTAGLLVLRQGRTPMQPSRCRAA